METIAAIYEKLYRIYNKHRRRYKENSYDSQQMCLMWSTNDPPDEIVETEPFCDIEAAFGISLDNEDDCLDLYDMTLKEASQKIYEMQNQK